MFKQSSIHKKLLKREDSESDIILVVPPFAEITQPSIGVHLLQACAKEAGFQVNILYGSILMASQIGEDLYRKITRNVDYVALRERYFSGLAFGFSPWEPKPGESVPPEFAQMEERAQEWLISMTDWIFEYNPRILGCTSSYQQTPSSVALLNRCKEQKPDLVSIIGGSNCEGEMAEGILSLGAKIDYVFSGESDIPFVPFLKQIQENRLPSHPIIPGEACLNMDQIPLPDYSEFFEQYRFFLPDSHPSGEEDSLGVPYETSRGCWWGQKHHCTFCGLNGSTMMFREKSPDKVVREAILLLEKYPVSLLNVADNIMPRSYFKRVIPELSEKVQEKANIFYEQKANLSLQEIIALKKAKVLRIQPGIESLNTAQLRRMDKGVQASQNIRLLRYTRSVGLKIYWNILIGFPGDQPEDYREMLEILPSLSHLQPPTGVFPVVFDRFSPYYNRPEDYGIRNLRPAITYSRCFPEHTDFRKLAYHFIGEFESAIFEQPELVRELEEKVKGWVDTWWADESAELPNLHVTSLYEGQYLLIDTRGLPGTESHRYLNREQAKTVLTERRLEDREQVEWALSNQYLLALDNRLVPLATASPEILEDLERSA